MLSLSTIFDWFFSHLWLLHTWNEIELMFENFEVKDKYFDCMPSKCFDMEYENASWIQSCSLIPLKISMFVDSVILLFYALEGSFWKQMHTYFCLIRNSEYDASFQKCLYYMTYILIRKRCKNMIIRRKS